MTADTTTAPAPAAPPRDRPRRFGPHAVRTAVLIATSTGADGLAALLAWERTTVVARLVEQLRDLGIPEVLVLTRLQWEADLRAAVPSARVQATSGAAEDLRLIARLARENDGGMFVCPAEVITQHEALAGLIINPRVITGALVTIRPSAHRIGYRTRIVRNRLMGVASPYHSVHKPTATALGAIKVGPDERERLAEAAERAAVLAEAPSPELQARLEQRRGGWTRGRKRAVLNAAADAAGRPRPEPSIAELDAMALDEAGREDVERRVAAARDDTPALLLVALVRDGDQVSGAALRRLFWARPRANLEVARAAQQILSYDEDRALLDSAVKSSDGFFTTFFVSPYSRYIARWCAHRGITPNQVTVFSMLLGLLSAAAFATGERWGLIAGALLLQAAFTFDCVDGQLARYTRTFTRFGAWLDSILDRTKEYVVFAGLAIGAARTGHDAWLLAGCALALQVARHAIDFSYPASQQQRLLAKAPPPLEEPFDGPPRAAAAAEVEEDDEPRAAAAVEERPGLWQRWRGLDASEIVTWIRKMILFPIGERFAVISIAAALFHARVTFIALLVWGGFALAYVCLGRTLRSLRSHRKAPEPGAAEQLALYRDDGPLARALGRAVGARVPTPAAACVGVGALPALVLIATGGGDVDWPLVAAAVAWSVLWGGISYGRPLADPLRWAVPASLRALEYGGLLWAAALAGRSSWPAAFVLLCALAWRHYDLVYRLRVRKVPPPRWVAVAAGGWEIRLALGFALLAAGALPAAFFVLGGILLAGLVAESAGSWVEAGRGRPGEYDDNDDDEAAE